MLERLVADWLRTYSLLVHVPLVKLPRPDGVRAADPQFQRTVADRLRFELAAWSVPRLDLEPDGSENWLDEVEAAVARELAPPQLQLPGFIRPA
jgi:hypothetical protein